MKITKRQLRSIIREAMEEVSMYDQGREDSLAGIRPQLPDEDYMMGYNEAQMDAGLPKMQAPSDSGRGKKLDPSKLKGAFAGKQRGSQPRYVGPTVPQNMMNRIDALRRGDLQDHLYDIVDAIESGDPDYTMQTLKLNLRDAEKLDKQ